MSGIPKNLTLPKKPKHQVWVTEEQQDKKRPKHHRYIRIAMLRKAASIRMQSENEKNATKKHY